MKKIFLLIIILIFLTSLSSESMSFSAEENVIVGFIDDYPLTFKKESGAADGFAIDILNHIFEK